MQTAKMGSLSALLIAWSFLLFCIPAAASETQWSVGDTNITSITVSPDGEKVAVGTYDATANVFDSEGNPLFTYEALNVVTGVAFLDDGSLLISSDDRHIYRVDGQGNVIWDNYIKKLVTGIAASTDGSNIAAIVKGGTAAYIIDQAGEIAGEIDIGIQPRKIGVSADGQWIAAAGSDQYVYLFNDSHELAGKFSVSGTIDALTVTNEGIVVAGTTSKTVFIFNSDGSTHAAFNAADAVTAVDATNDGTYFAAADFIGNYYVLDADGNEVWREKGDGAGRAIKISPDGSTLYTGSGTGVIRKFDIGTVISSARQQKTITNVSIAAGSVIVLAALGTWLYILKKKNKLGVLKSIWRERYSYLMLAPSFILIFVFMYYPAFSGLFHSFYDWNPGARSTFVGLANYERMLNDPYVAKGVGNLLLLLVTGIFKTIVPPLLVAELIFFLRSRKLQYGFRTGFVTSMIIPSVAGLLIWQNLYDPNVGLINKVLEAVGLGEFAHPWLGDPNTAIWAIIFMGFPFVGILSLLIFYAGLISIPQELIESAKMDGASTGKIIRSIHLPLLAGQMKLLIILAFIGTIQDFGGILIVTGGGPLDSTYVPALQMYYAATIFNDLGYASALGVSMFLIIMAITVMNMKFIKTQTD